jgi:hypothetical protein
MHPSDGSALGQAEAGARSVKGQMLHLFRRTLPSVCLARPVLDLIGKREKSRGHFAVERLGSQAAQFDDLVLNQGQPLDVANHLFSQLSDFPPIPCHGWRRRQT